MGAWAYGVRGSFKDDRGKPNLWPEEVAPLMESQPHPATIRKIESDPDYHPDDMVQELFRVYRRLGDQRGVYVPQPPDSGTASQPADLANAIREQTQAISDLVALLRPLVESHDQRVTDLAQIVGTLTERALQDDPKRSVPDGTVG